MHCRTMGIALTVAALLIPIAVQAQYLDTRTLSWSRVAGRPTLAKELVPAADYRIAGAVIGAAFFGAVRSRLSRRRTAAVWARPWGVPQSVAR